MDEGRPAVAQRRQLLLVIASLAASSCQRLKSMTATTDRRRQDRITIASALNGRSSDAMQHVRSVYNVSYFNGPHHPSVGRQ